MKKIFSLLVLLMTLATGTTRAYEVQIGEGTSATGYHPFYTLYNYSISESLYLASELTAAGVEAGPITSLSWYATNETGSEQQGISIWLANVSDTELTTSSHSSTGMTQVYTNGTVTPVIGWNEFQCNGDFSWDGTSNLLILVQRNNGDWNSTINWQATTGLGFNCMSYRYQDSGAYDVTASNTMYTSSTRPNIIIKGEGAPAGPEVTFNDAKTEASFDMPSYDVTVNYELVRDMTVQMTTQVGDGNDGYRIRIKKDNQTGKFVPAEMTPQAMAGLITVTDDIEQQELTNNTDYTVSIFAVDDNDQPTGTAIAFADLEPGRYVAFATAKEGTIYDGQTLPSNVFKLLQVYEVTIPAGEYATYYKDEALYVDATEQPYAKLYTVTDVSETTATVTELTVAPALTPILVQNTAQTTQTILLITTTTTDVVNYYDGFKGTLVDQEMPASSENVDYYVCNGKEFFWVKDAGTIRANRCWLEIANSTTQGARSLAIVFGEATKITNTNFTNLTNGDWYDLNGRKLNAIPTKKGIYILNGRKVVIK